MSFRYLRKKLNSKGSASIEFIAMVPFVLLLMVMLWQFLVGAYALITAQSAVNEAAKVYAETESTSEATAAARKVIDATGDSIKMSTTRTYISGGSDSDPDFTAKVGVDLELVFLSNDLFGGSVPSIPINTNVSSRVIK